MAQAYMHHVNVKGCFAIVVAAFVFAYAHNQSCEEKVDVASQEEPTSLLQTFHQVNSRSHTERARSPPQQSLPLREAAQNADSLEAAASTAQVAAQDAYVRSVALGGEEHCVATMPWDLKLLFHGLRFAGMHFPKARCVAGDPSFGLMSFMLEKVDKSMPGSSGDAAGKGHDTYWICLPVAYAIITTLILGRMMMFMMYPASIQKRDPSLGVRRPEAESWNRGYLNWLFCDFVDEWIAKWGSVEDSDATKITANDLDSLGDADDDVNVSFRKMDFLWSEEVATAGLPDASLGMVLFRFVGWYRLISVMVWSTIYSTALFIGPPIAMAWVIRYCQHIYVLRYKGHIISYREMVPATIAIILLFQGLPFFIAVSNSITNLINMRISMRLFGGLSAVCYKKAQRLPLNSLKADEAEPEDVKKNAKEADKRMRKEATASGSQQSQEDSDCDSSKQTISTTKESTETATESTGAESQLCKKWGHHFAGDLETCSKCGAPRPGTSAVTGSDTLVFDEDGMVVKPDDFSLIQLVSNDINNNQSAIFASVRIASLIPVVLLLFILLWGRVGLALVGTLVWCFVMVHLISIVAASQGGWTAAFYFYAGKRLMFTEDMLFNIRVIKAFGWEGIMQERILELRGLELQVLWGFYKRLGTFFGLIWQVPRGMILTALWGTCLVYGTDTPMNIFATIPLLFTFQIAVMSCTMCLPTVISGAVSVGRVETFLKLDEAPLPRSTDAATTEETPSWVDVWPEKPIGGNSSCSLTIQGSFSWHAEGEPSLKNLNLIVQAGSSVAVLGKVGSGKSSLLQAMCGEMHPLDDARISIPNRIAYSGQVPYICEGTLKENVVYGEPYDESFFKSCVSAASLDGDIRSLPGGVEVPIGSRGIVLSGGQRARVSMARVAYCRPAEAVLIDDPFAAVDSHTAKHLLTHFVHGKVLGGRTKVVVCQPDPERIQAFDKVVIISKGRIVVEGSPKEVMQTTAYTNLLNAHQKDSLATFHSGGLATPRAPGTPQDAEILNESRFTLYEEEAEIRPDWKTVDYFVSMGGRWYLFFCCFLFLIMMVMNLQMGIVLQHWASDTTLANAGLLVPRPLPLDFLWPFLYWWAAAIAVWVVSWYCGMWFTHYLSKRCVEQIMQRIMRAPIDRFFDKTPVGRIMNRMSTDLLNMDVSVFNRITQTIAVACTNVVPIVYLHLLMPLYFTVFSIPFYFVLWSVTRRFWGTLVPMRYLSHVSKSKTDSVLTDVAHSNAFVRASRKGDYRFQDFAARVQDQLKADFAGNTFLQRWLVNRVFLMMGFYVCTIVLISIWVPGAITLGGIGLCLANMFQLLNSVEDDVGTIVDAQFQFISIKRLYDYTDLPQEADYDKESDKAYKNYSIRIKRAKLGKLERQIRDGKIHVERSRNGYIQHILEQTEENMFAAPKGFRLMDPTSTELAQCDDWHRLVAVNGKRCNTVGVDSNASMELLVQELCKGRSSEVVLQVQSGWLISGAHVVFQDLVSGYGDIPVDIIKGISLNVQPCSKLGIVGTTGCGKSTLLLCILRILEARSGKIFINDVDVSKLGLRTLRSTIGMVQQDPVLMQSTLRDNLDAFAEFDDATIWRAIDMVQMKDHVANLPNGLGYEITGDGGGLSFGQRQLLCMARMVLRQPALILLDEATSALDPATQQKVQLTIEKSFPDSTIIMIAHRLETVANFDSIVVLKDGKVVEQGSPGELREKEGGAFRGMWGAKQTW